MSAADDNPKTPPPKPAEPPPERPPVEFHDPFGRFDFSPTDGADFR